MNILHLTTNDVGGAGEAAYRVHSDLKCRGINSSYFTMENKSDKIDVVGIKTKSIVRRFIFKVFRKITLNFLNKTDVNYCYYDHGQYWVNDYQEILNSIDAKPDIVVFYWTSTFINPKVMEEFSALLDAKVFIYLTDMAPLTGGCHFSWGCDGYTKLCGSCPALYSDRKNDISRKTMLLKTRYLADNDITVISPNSFVTQQVRQSSLFKNSQIEEVYFGVDPLIFKKMEKSKLKTKYGYSEDDRVIFFGASNVHEKRKGFVEFVAALDSLYFQLNTNERKKIRLCIAGDAVGIEQNFKFQTTLMGHVNYDILVELYNLADVVASSSIEDSGPLMVCEALMCGTPVVAFEIGIAVSMLSKETGYLAKFKNVKDFSKGLKYVLSTDKHEYSIMSEKCIDIALNLCEAASQSSKLYDLFSEGDNN